MKLEYNSIIDKILIDFYFYSFKMNDNGKVLNRHESTSVYELLADVFLLLAAVTRSTRT